MLPLGNYALFRYFFPYPYANKVERKKLSGVT
jgi:hypothetical protein